VAAVPAVGGSFLHFFWATVHIVALAANVVLDVRRVHVASILQGGKQLSKG
jgi:hypothetical protein